MTHLKLDYTTRPEIKELWDYMVSIRRNLHVNAETAMKEYDTAALITRELVGYLSTCDGF